MLLRSTMNRICVIGAGPSGLAVTQSLIEKGFAVDVYEKHTNAGGIWDINNPCSGLFPTTHTIASLKSMLLKGMNCSDNLPDFPKHTIYFDLLSELALSLSSIATFKFSAEVKEIRVNQDTIHLSYLYNEKIHHTSYNEVIFATGLNAIPYIPPISSLGNFKGDVLHSIHYKNKNLLENKRILIVGCGHSGCDLAIDSANFAKSVSVSVRRGYYFVPKYFMGKPINELNSNSFKWLPTKFKRKIFEKIHSSFLMPASYFGFPEVDYDFFEKKPIINDSFLSRVGQGDITIKPDIKMINNKEVSFTDNSHEEYDLIFLCTGYKPCFDNINLYNEPFSLADHRLLINIFLEKNTNFFLMGMLHGDGGFIHEIQSQGDLISTYLDRKYNNKNKAIKLIKLIELIDKRIKKKQGNLRVNFAEYQKNISYILSKA